MLVANSSPEKGLTRNSRAPASIARRRLSASPWTLVMVIGVVGSRCEMISEAATPSMPGMLMSMTITSGRRSIADLTASSPDSAVPHTSTSCSKLKSFVRCSRVSGMSSTIRTLITCRSPRAGPLAAELLRRELLDDVRDRQPVLRDQSVDGDTSGLLGGCVLRVAQHGRQGSDLTHLVLGELDHLGVLVGTGEDDDHIFDGRGRLLRLRAARCGRCGGGRSRGWLDPRLADIQDALVLQDGLDRSHGV